MTILALPVGEGTPEGLCDVLIDHNRHHPRCDAGFLDLGSRLRRCTCHAALTLATDLKMCLRLVLVLHGNGEPIENTGGLIREYLPKGTQITTHPVPATGAIAEELG